MQENSNKAIFVNTAVLYTKLFVSVICGLFITRYSLSALGVMDYGLYSVIGSIITFISIINTIMVSTSQRFITVAIGENRISEAQEQFSVCFCIHCIIAVVTILVAIPLGLLYIQSYLNYDGEISKASIVFVVSLVASAFSFIGVPYNGLLAAKERFMVFCIPDIISHFIRLAMAIVLMYFFSEKLLIYAISMALLTVFPTVVYVIYCKRNFGEIVRLKIVKNRRKYFEIINFSAWVGYGAVAFVGKSQGAAVLVNLFFNTAMNTALGIANSLSSLIGQFAQSVAQPIAPQITKNYVSGNRDRCDRLLILSTKLSYVMMLLISAPFLVNCEWIINIWLGEVPDYSVMFTLLLIVDALIDSMNSGIKNIIFADGNIKAFQIVPSTLKILAIICAFFLLKAGYPAYALLYSYIFFTVIIVITNQIILKKTVNFDNREIFLKSYLPSIIITILFVPVCFIAVDCLPIIRIGLSEVYLVILIYFVGCSKSEKEYLTNIIKNKLKNA